MTPTFPHVLYGGDYNPDQWPRETWDEDIRLMRESGVNIATLPVFGWVALEPEEGRFTFEWLDDILDRLAKGGVEVCLCTATASQPAWLDQKYPDVLITDEHGVKRRHGNRHSFCPHSPNYRRLSVRLARTIAERYKNYPGLRVWHVNNEYGTHCYCDLCAEAFRTWLKARFGTLDELNRRWYTSFWGHTYTDWSQIEPPFAHGERSMQALRIDYDRFMTESLLGCYKAEADALREITPGIPVTTNFMGTFFGLDYHRWAKELDVVAWDSYPPLTWSPAQVAFSHALMRGVKQGQPFMLMEQSPSQQNWMPHNRLKPPGVLRLQSYQAIAHGADAVMYFQWRRGRGAQEKFHGAIVEHGGSSENRVFQEVAELGTELERLGSQTLGGRIEARAAILFSWENWWALKYSSGPNVDLNYLDVCRTYFAVFAELGIQADVISPDADPSGYAVIVAPLLYMLRKEAADRISEAVSNGATLVTGPFSAMVNEDDMVYANGCPGPLRECLGVFVEETDAPPPSETNWIAWESGQIDRGSLLCDRLRLEGAKPIARFTNNFFAGEPAVTRNEYGRGVAYYVGTIPDLAGAFRLVGGLGLESALPGGSRPPHGVEVTKRGDLIYLLNHATENQTVGCSGRFTDLLSGESVADQVALGPRAVRILRPTGDRS